MGGSVRLSEMQTGQAGRVTAVRCRGAHGRRIRDMGVVPGVAIVVVGEAPLGDPIEIKVMGYNLSLRRNEAVGVMVEIEA